MMNLSQGENTPLQMGSFVPALGVGSLQRGHGAVMRCEHEPRGIWRGPTDLTCSEPIFSGLHNPSRSCSYFPPPAPAAVSSWSLRKIQALNQSFHEPGNPGSQLDGIWPKGQCILQSTGHTPQKLGKRLRNSH